MQNYIGRFYGDFLFTVSLAGVLAQLFLVSRIMKFCGVPASLYFLPVIALTGYSIIAFFPILAFVRWAKVVENSTDYSLQNTARQALFLPTTREEKYKAKAAIDTFFVRFGDVLSAGLVRLSRGVCVYPPDVEHRQRELHGALAVARGRHRRQLSGAGRAANQDRFAEQFRRPLTLPTDNL